MADALCGPSNALQTFQKQTSIDRTLQQDRLTARHAQAESFRSIPGRNTGVIDEDFEAFQSGRPYEGPFEESQPLPHNGPSTSFHPNNQQHQPTLPIWTSDFQHLHLEEARSSPIPQAQFHHHAPLYRSTPSGWHEEFLRQQHQPTPNQQQQQPQKSNIGWGHGHTGGVLPQPNIMLSPTAQQKQPNGQVEEVFDEAAFERAFESARSDVHSRQQELQLDQDLYRTEEAGANLKGAEMGNPMDHRRIGSDRILDEAEDKEEKTNDEADADELAKTAGQLLENVKGDQSRKFHESSFLSLMRQLRDKEVRVEGDKFVDVSMPSSSA